MTDTDSAFTDKDREDIVAQLTEADLRERSQALHNAQETWEKLAYLSNPKMPCPECTGAGSVHGGSLGDICVRCMGQRVVEQPGSPQVEMPPFAQLRAAISAYGDAMADLEFPAGHRGKRNLALPPPASVPTLESIHSLSAEALGKVRQLEGQPGVVPAHQLPSPKKAKGLAGDDDAGVGGGYEDAELDDMQDGK